jgi:hypothetical protein
MFYRCKKYNRKNIYAQVAHIIKMGSFVFFKGIPLSLLLGAERTDKAQRSLCGKILCAHLLFAVNYTVVFGLLVF